MYVVYNPMLGSDNVGDEIIIESINREFNNLRIAGQRIDIPSHYYPGRLGRSYLSECNFAFAAGSNMLGFKDYLRRQWKVSNWDLIHHKNKILLFGVGWQSYTAKPNWFNKWALNRMLDHVGPHSVRDEYTKKTLQKMGFSNVYNTGCPTMWELVDKIPDINKQPPSERVIYTITHYNKNIKRDIAWLNKLQNCYQELIFWPQSFADEVYHSELEKHTFIKSVKLPCELSSLKRVLTDVDVDYIGTRLHAGVYAMQHRRRALILAIDNRATEISTDTALPIFNCDDLKKIENLSKGEIDFNLSINMREISNFKNCLIQYVTKD